jgi:flagellar hook-basal body complex protein FliE
MVTTSNFTQATSAYQNAAKMQSSTASAMQSGNLMGVEKPDTAFKPDFEALVGEALDKARGAGYSGESKSAEALANKAELHELVTAVNNADLTLRTVVAVRDRMVNAYQDILKMPI